MLPASTSPAPGRWARGCAAAALDAALPIVIGITLGKSTRVFHTALPGSSADSDGWLERKTRVARRYGRSSYGVGLSFRAEGKSSTGTLHPPRSHALRGARRVFPLTIAGVGVVGTVRVSGLPQADDRAFVVAQLRAFAATL